MRLTHLVVGVDKDRDDAESQTGSRLGRFYTRAANPLGNPSTSQPIAIGWGSAGVHQTLANMLTKMNRHAFKCTGHATGFIGNIQSCLARTANNRA